VLAKEGPMFHGFTRTRRATQWSPRGEQLEGRALLTGAGGNTFALEPATIDKPGGSVSETFKIDPAQFTIPTKMILGVDVASASTSALGTTTAKPTISAVSAVKPTTTATGTDTAATQSEVLTPLTLTRTTGSSAVLVPIAKGKAAQSFEATITGDSQTSGDFLVGYYLPGDADGDGVVSQADIKAITKALNSKAGDAAYSFDADANRDGKIDQQDLNIAKQNLGVQTKIQASVTANLDPASDSGAVDRVTEYQNVIFEGTDTPGAQLTFSEVNQKTPDAKTTVKPDGTYSLTIPLAEGTDNFKVTSVDSFGQQISGTISPVTYQKPTTPVTSPTKPTSPPKPLYPSTVATPLALATRAGRMHVPKARSVAPRGDQAAMLRARLALLRMSKPASSAKSTSTVPTTATTAPAVAVGEPTTTGTTPTTAATMATTTAGTTANPTASATTAASAATTAATTSAATAAAATTGTTPLSS
jgi:hypothetical protein